MLPDGQCRSKLQFSLASVTDVPQKLDRPSGRPAILGTGAGVAAGSRVGSGVGCFVGSPNRPPSIRASQGLSMLLCLYHIIVAP